MLSISPDQMRVFTDQSDAVYATQLASFVTLHFPNEALLDHPNALAAEIGRIRHGAADAGLNSDQDVRTLLVLRFTYGPAFDRADWFRAILADPFGRKTARLTAAGRANLDTVA